MNIPKQLFLILFILSFAFLGMVPTQCDARSGDNLRYPLYFGTESAKSKIILYYNIQCPSCVTLWPEITALLAKLDPATTSLVVQGGGNSGAGHKVLLAANVLAQQNQNLAVDFITAVHAAGRTPYTTDIQTWAINFAKNSKLSFDEVLFSSQFNNQISDIRRREGKQEIAQKYSITSTPTLIINEKVYTKEMSADAIKKHILIMR